MFHRMSLVAFAIAPLFLAACQSATPDREGGYKAVGDPDAAVADIRDAYPATPPDSRYRGYETTKGKKMRSRVALRRQSEDLLFSHPDHVDGRMTAALLAYEAQDPIEAARHLDYLLRVDPAQPDAALLRARIALESGNPDLARRLLDQQVTLRPEHAGLREAHASSLFLTGDLEHAREALDEAERLGADAGRVAYNRGLVAEETGDIVQAARHYRRALKKAPGWSQPANRLRGLDAQLPAPYEPPAGKPRPVKEPKPAPAKAPTPPTNEKIAPEAGPTPTDGVSKTVKGFPPAAPRKKKPTTAEAD